MFLATTLSVELFKTACKPHGGIYQGQLDQLEYLSSYSFDDNRLTVGIDIEEQLNERTDAQQDQRGVFAEWQGKLGDDLSYSIGVRHDDNDVFGEFTSYRVSSAYVQPLGRGHSLKYRASYGTGFRVPSLYEQWYNVDSGFSFGEAANTALEEETSEGFDIGVEFHTANGDLFEVVYFNQEISNASILTCRITAVTFKKVVPVAQKALS